MSHIDFAHNQYANGRYKITSDLRKFISESAFLKIYIAWETFLENCFLDYLMGEPSRSGNVPIKHATPINRIHANDFIVGTQRFVDWSNPQTLRTLSKIYFDQGYVFNTVLSAIESDLFDLKTIRNSAAHISSTTTNKLDALSSRLLGRVCNNYSAYDLLFSNHPRNATLTILDNYITILDISAENISNG